MFFFHNIIVLISSSGKETLSLRLRKRLQNKWWEVKVTVTHFIANLVLQQFLGICARSSTTSNFRKWYMTTDMWGILKHHDGRYI